MANRHKKKPGSDGELRSLAESSPVSTPTQSRPRESDRSSFHVGNSSSRVPTGSLDDSRRMQITQIGRYSQDPPEYEARHSIPTSESAPEEKGGFIYKEITVEEESYVSIGNAGGGSFHRHFLAHVHKVEKISVKGKSHGHYGNMCCDEFGKFHIGIIEEMEEVLNQGVETPRPMSASTSTPASAPAPAPVSTPAEA